MVTQHKGIKACKTAIVTAPAEEWTYTGNIDDRYAGEVNCGTNSGHWDEYMKLLDSDDDTETN